ncbi:MAG: hypothetical protein RIB98_16370 [Acidimicrobiales bacterium]
MKQGRANRGRRALGVVVAAAMFTLSGCTFLGRVNVPDGYSTAAPPSTAASTDPAISATGEVVAFVSASDDLVAGDTNGTSDVYVRDGLVTSRASLTNGGGESAGTASQPSVSADGRYVAFVSTGADLVAGDTNGTEDVFVRDRVAGTTERVSVTNGGGQSAGTASQPSVSADGRYVAFVSTGADLVAGDTNGSSDVFVRDRVASTTERVSVRSSGNQANGASSEPSISPSGEWVAYTSLATNLVSGDSNGVADVFLSARAGGDTTRASVPDTVTRPFQQSNGASSEPVVSDEATGYLGAPAPVIAFSSEATNLEGTDGNSGRDVFVTSRVFGAIDRTLRLSNSAEIASAPSLALIDGGPRFVVSFVVGDDVVSVERLSPVDLAGVQRRTVSVDNDGGPANGASGSPAVSGDGRFVAFESTAGNLAGGTAVATAGDIRIGRATKTSVEAVTPDRLGLLETRDLTVSGANFDPGSSAISLGGLLVNSTTFVSADELVVNVTATVDAATEDFQSLYILTAGRAGGPDGLDLATCEDCIEIAAVVEQPGDVDIEITEIAIEIGGFEFATPSCPLGACPAISGEVSVDGDLEFGLDSIELDPIEIPVELIQGLEVTVGLVPKFVAPNGTVVPANGAIDLGFGFAIGLESALLPSSCAIGPVQASLSAGPGGDPLGVAYDQADGTAVLHGGFTEELAITGCGLFTGVLNTLFGFPIPIAENQLELRVQLDPVLTGTVVP